jgi:hypothetical protein
MRKVELRFAKATIALRNSPFLIASQWWYLPIGIRSDVVKHWDESLAVDR